MRATGRPSPKHAPRQRTAIKPRSSLTLSRRQHLKIRSLIHINVLTSASTQNSLPRTGFDHSSSILYQSSPLITEITTRCYQFCDLETADQTYYELTSPRRYVRLRIAPNAAALINELKSVLRRLHSCLIISSRCSLTRNERMSLGFHRFVLSEVFLIA